ncbi:MAG: tRNA dihydrouridine(20/20a) synthase DusA [Gammaproteobacteria bacterium]|nr:tRNA dihydrouridine(20/20a) synthase DusA [Gammaproteobacteria bacterium]
MDFSPYLTHYEAFAHLNALSIAPMVDHTDRHCRRLLRLIAPKATLYTEMLVAQAIVYGNADRILKFSTVEQPVIAQIAGADPSIVGDATQIVAEFGYDAVNFNVGCPSKRVKSGGFGACLMERPGEVFAIVRAMKQASELPVTVKCRLGTDRVSGYEQLLAFAKGLADCGVDGIIVHARIANLSGASTRYNLNVPPLDWEMVKRLQHDVPDITFTLNGGLIDVSHIEQVRSWIDRVMVGRIALNRPDILASMHASVYGELKDYSPWHIAKRYREYMVEQLELAVPLRAMTRHMLSLFHGVQGAKRFRQHLSTHANRPEATIETFDDAMENLVKSASIRSTELREPDVHLIA